MNRLVARIGAFLVLGALAAVLLLSAVLRFSPSSAATPSANAGAIAGPSMSPGVTPTPASSTAALTASPAASAATQSGPTATRGCRYLYEHPYWVDPSLAGNASFSDLVITGEVVRVSEARWATADGSPVRPGSFTDVYRVVRLRVTGVGKASTDSARAVSVGQTIDVRVLGGTIDCDTYSSSGDTPVVVGQSKGWFLSSEILQMSLRSVPPADFDTVAHWPIVRGKVVQFEPGAPPLTPSAFLAASAR